MTPIPAKQLIVFHFRHRTIADAEAYHVAAADDSNNAFCLGFATPALDDRGVTHVLEHMVLCGSEKYPVREPFFRMTRRSLSTYMNALTGPDYTLYPFATTNSKDYANLLSVYLDAVFHPLLRKDDFLQEAHRIEFQSSTTSSSPSTEVLAAAGGGGSDGSEAAGGSEEVVPGPVVEGEGHAAASGSSAPAMVAFSGTVYNEMKGAASEPGRCFTHTVLKQLMPSTHYRFVSGGVPRRILDLKHDDVVDFHRLYYRPGNSVVFTYGSWDPTDTLLTVDAAFAAKQRELIERGASHLADKGRVAVPAETSFRDWTAPPPTQPDAALLAKQVQARGPSDPMGDPASQKRVLFAAAVPGSVFEAGGRPTLRDEVEWSVTDELLTDGPASPMYQALFAPTTTTASTTSGGSEPSQDAGKSAALGARFAPMSGAQFSMTCPTVGYGVSGASDAAVKPETVRDAVRGALKRVSAEGFPSDRIEGVVFQSELQQRHRSSDYGVNLLTGLAARRLVMGSSATTTGGSGGVAVEDLLDWSPHLARLRQEPPRLDF